MEINWPETVGIWDEKGNRIYPTIGQSRIQAGAISTARITAGCINWKPGMVVPLLPDEVYVPDYQQVDLSDALSQLRVEEIRNCMLQWREPPPRFGERRYRNCFELLADRSLFIPLPPVL